MSRSFVPKVVSANDLRAGHVVYFSAAETWVRDIAEAEVLTDEAEAQLRLLSAMGHTTVAVGVYLVDVTQGPAGPVPVALREQFRAKGPSIRPTKEAAAKDAAHV
ncbi:DUF2849 domain-containing protein [Rhodobacter capsulatus]|uniref:DUF2849 domain-containing protein n=1 Tax=Rhodobacter capsulatus TaxID=1061 RepID=UPI004025417E